MKLVITGASGFLGRTLAAFFGDATLVSRANGGWERLPALLEGSDAVINLAGRSVNCRYNEANRAEIYASRLDTTRALGDAIAACTRPPKVWLNASSATLYRHALDRPMDELTGEVGTGFSVDVVQRWEQALAEAQTPQTRKVALRMAMVMGRERAGVFDAFRGLARAGLAGPMAGGAQYVSWIHAQDCCRAIAFLIENDTLSGGVNLAAPNPLPNREFLAQLRREVGMPLGLPTARWMLEVGAWLRQTETELLLKSRRVVPARLLKAGFTFQYPTWPDALKELCG